MHSRTLRIGLPLAFFLFIGSIIYMADSANYNFAFYWVGAIPYGDKIAHMLLYGIMTLLLNYGLGFKSYRLLGFEMQLGAVIVLVFAGLEELSQYWLPSRSCDILDFVADLVGAVLFSLRGATLCD
jgi:hypothetical protein